MAAAAAVHAVDGEQKTLPVDEGGKDANDSRYHCVASSVAQDRILDQTAAIELPYFQDAQFTADGTSIIALCKGNRLRSYVLPPDLLEPSSQPKHIVQYSETTLGSPIQSYATYPDYQLQDPSKTVYLAASRDQPIKLYNALYCNYQHASYPLIDQYTEVYLAPSSLVFGSSGQHFIAAISDRIYAFDISRDGHGPKASCRISSSIHMGGSTFGLIKTMSLDRYHGVLAAGSLQRNIALFENDGLGACIATFKLPDEHRGNGITSLGWSPDGTYLLAAERQSDCTQVFDVRYLRRHVSVLTGRKAKTPQVLGISVSPSDEGFVLSAGGTDGMARMWSNPGRIDDTQPPDFEFKAHDNPVTSVIWHPGGAVIATCSAVDGMPHMANVDPDNNGNTENDSDDNDESDDSIGVIPLGTQHHKVPITPRASTSHRLAATDSLKIWSP
ncbi:WD40 repeat-like protein [Polychaeton citri CBS 116435]|uniref:WD40 repeat-like protein n=1 Tax=Polychaeton citri CBS 116435 TaxID=1314669 RepID=A0A9P4Q3W3_9PEZI|nr:WD40 repeat-like protein [Polychaeton citri CBS 116435]